VKEQKNLSDWHDPQAEMACLGGVVNHGVEALATLASVGIGVEHFHEKKCRTLATAAWAMFAKGDHIDMLTIGSALRLAGMDDAMEFMEQCLELMPSIHYIAHYAKIIDQFHRRWLLVDAAKKTITEATNSEEPMQAAARSVNLITQASAQRIQRQTLAEVADAVMHRWQTLGTDGCDVVNGLRTGINDFDQAVAGLSNSLHVLAGRPSAGKTSFANKIALNVARRGVPVLIFALDINRTRWVQRSLCTIAGVSLSKLNMGFLKNSTGRDAEKLAVAVEVFKRLPIYIYDDVRSLDEIAQSYRFHKIKDGIGLAVIDYIQKINVPGIRTTDMHACMSEVCNTLMQLHAELHMPTLCLSQLNRSGERDKRCKPSLTDLRESGSIEESATTVTLLSKVADFDYKSAGIDEAKQRPIRVDVAKNQDGTTIELPYWFNCPYFDFQVAPENWGQVER